MRYVIIALLLLAACVAPVEDTAPVVDTSIKEQVEQQLENGGALPAVKEEQGDSEKLTVEPVVEQVITEKPKIGRQLLNEAKTKVKGYAFRIENAIVWVKDDMRRIRYERIHRAENELTDVYLNTTAKTAVGYCNIDREAEIEGDSFDFERRNCDGQIDDAYTVNYDDYFVKGPFDWMEEYADKEPTRVQTALLTVGSPAGSKSIQPSLVYEENGKTIILRIDSRYKYPLKVDEGGTVHDFTESYVGTAIIDGDQFKINDALVTYTPATEFWRSQSI